MLRDTKFKHQPHPGGKPGADLESTSHRCYFREVVFEWELTKETIHLPLDCLQGGRGWLEERVGRRIDVLTGIPRP